MEDIMEHVIETMWSQFLEHLPSIIAAVFAGLAYFTSYKNNKQLNTHDDKLTKTQDSVDIIKHTINGNLDRLISTIGALNEKISQDSSTVSKARETNKKEAQRISGETEKTNT